MEKRRMYNWKRRTHNNNNNNKNVTRCVKLNRMIKYTWGFLERHYSEHQKTIKDQQEKLGTLKGKECGLANEKMTPMQD